METVRTPDSRFESPPGYAFDPNYAELPDVDGGTLRIHYLDEGPSDGQVIVLLHGEPSWSFLYRKMIPPLTTASLRCIVPDLVGFGRSDKPTKQTDYTYARHVEWIRTLLFDRLDLRDITLFGQDWGGLIGLRVVAEHPYRCSRIVVGNTFLPTGDTPPNDSFLRWQKFSQESPAFDVGRVIGNGSTSDDLSPEVVAAYDAPFPDDSYKAGARIFLSLVPTRPDDPASGANRAAWTVFESWTKPELCAFSDSDPITKGGERAFQSRIPGTHGQPHTTVTGAGHFLQEDNGEDLATVIVDFVRATA